MTTNRPALLGLVLTVMFLSRPVPAEDAPPPAPGSAADAPAATAAPTVVRVRPAPAPATSTKTNNFGFAAGYISGYGLAYRHWGTHGNGYQLTFVPVGKVNPDEGFFNSSIGAMGLRSLHETSHTNFFGYYGGHYNFYYDEMTYTYYDTTPVKYDNQDIAHNLYVGGGLGMEIHFWNLNYTLMFGYAGNGREERNIDRYPGNTTAHNGKWVGSLEFQPSVETGLFYCF